MRFQTLLKTAAILSVCGAVCMHAEMVSANAAEKKSGITIDAKTFPDAAFREIIRKQADKNGDGFLSKAEVQKAAELDILIRHKEGHPGYGATDRELFNHQGEYTYDGKAIDLTGIETLQNLEKIRIHNSKPSNLPFEKLKKLKTFEISAAPAVEFDFSKALALQKVVIMHSGVKGKKLDFSANTQLTEICVGASKVSRADLGENSRLKKLEIFACSLKEIDLSGCKNLEYAYLSDNQLNSLDVSGNQKLQELYLQKNLLKNLDLSSNRQLENLFIDGNPFAAIDSRTLAVADDCKLSMLWADNLKKCKEIDVSYIPSLTSIYARSGNYERMKIGEDLRSVQMSSSKIKVLDEKTLQAPKEARLDNLDYNSGVLEKLDTRHLKNLVHLQAPDNRLEEINLSGNPKLFHSIAFEGNPVRKLIVRGDIPEEQKSRYKEFVKKSGGEVLFEN